MKSVLVVTVAAGALLSNAGAAFADNLTFFGYNLSASLQAAVAPTYQGGDRYTVFPSGNVAATHPGDFDNFFAPDDAASLALLHTKILSVGVAAALQENRGNDDELQGMRNIGWALQGGGFVNLWPQPWLRLHVEALKGLTAEDGWEVNSGADFVAHPTARWTVSGGPRYSWADAHYNNTYFGVTPAEASASPYIRTPYALQSGSLSAGLEASTEYKLWPRWRLTLSGNYDRMIGQPANSPLVRVIGSPNQLSFATGVRFLLSD